MDVLKYYNEVKIISNFNAVKVTSDSKTIKIAEVEQPNKNLLITITDKTGNTFLDFTRADDYVMYCYNEEKYLASQHYALNNEIGFMIQTQYKTTLLVRYQS
jgi:hypothetical protein